MPNRLIPLFEQVAVSSASLGFKQLTFDKLTPLLKLAYGSLKVTISQSEVTSRFYLIDSVYNRVNYPGLPNKPLPPDLAKIIKLLSNIKRSYVKIRKLHGEVIELGEKIFDLISRMKLHGLMDHSERVQQFGPAENLQESYPLTLHPIKMVKARFLTEQECHIAAQRYLKRLQQIDPIKWQEITQRIAAEDQRNLSIVAVDKSLIKKPSTTELINKALPRLHSLRRFKVSLASLDALGNNNYNLVLQLQNRYQQPQAVSEAIIARTSKELNQLVKGSRFIYRHTLVGRKNISLNFQLQLD